MIECPKCGFEWEEGEYERKYTPQEEEHIRGRLRKLGFIE